MDPELQVSLHAQERKYEERKYEKERQSGIGKGKSDVHGTRIYFLGLNFQTPQGSPPKTVCTAELGKT
jgi:hypothetical protein